MPTSFKVFEIRYTEDGKTTVWLMPECPDCIMSGVLYMTFPKVTEEMKGPNPADSYRIGQKFDLELTRTF